MFETIAVNIALAFARLYKRKISLGMGTFSSYLNMIQYDCRFLLDVLKVIKRIKYVICIFLTKL